MNKRIKKKLEKNIYKRIKTKSLTINKGDIVFASADMEQFAVNELYDIYCTIASVARKYGAETVFMPKFISIDKLTEQDIIQMESVIKLYREKENKNG